MTDLIVCLTNEKGIFEHVKRVVEDMEWNHVYIVTAEKDTSNMKFSKKSTIIPLDMTKTIEQLTTFIKERLQGKLTDLEVGVNMVGGKGKEHTALISAILKLGFGIRLVNLTPTGVKTL